jgi:hypothetical protein
MNLPEVEQISEKKVKAIESNKKKNLGIALSI